MATKTHKNKLTKTQEDMLELFFRTLGTNKHTTVEWYEFPVGKLVLKTLNNDGLMCCKPLNKKVFANLRDKFFFFDVPPDTHFIRRYRLSGKGLALCQELFDSGKTTWGIKQWK